MKLCNFLKIQAMVNVYDFLKDQGEEYKKLAFKDVLFVYYQCPQVEPFAKIYTHNNLIVYAITGKKVYHTPGKSHLLSEGSGAFIKKGGYYQERFMDLDWVVIAFFMPDSFIQQFIKDHRTLLPLKTRVKEPLEIFTPIHINEITKAFFEGMLSYFVQKPGPPENVIELKFHELLLNLLSDPQNNNILNYFINLSDTQKPLLHEVMEDNFMYNLSLDEYARIAQRSIASFKREFVEIFKVSPGKWLTEKRLLYAQMLLNSTPKNISEIANDSGFESASHFSRVFKEKFGTAPLQYRKYSTST